MKVGRLVPQRRQVSSPSSTIAEHLGQINVPHEGHGPVAGSKSGPHCGQSTRLEAVPRTAAIRSARLSKLRVVNALSAGSAL
jgi:hypothetical protein